jgi:hypothetical protein
MADFSTILLFIIIGLIAISISFFIIEPTYKLAYFMLLGLAFICLLNIYLTIFYYVKIRNSEGTPGPIGKKGPRGPKGEPGNCTFSTTCGITNPKDKILPIASNIYSIPQSCLSDPALSTCNDDPDIVAQAITIAKQINLLEDMALKTTMAESDFIDKLELCLRDPNACSPD